MRLKSIHAEGTQPIRKLEIDDLSDVVVLAGPNGVGKSRFLDALVAHFRTLNGSSSFWVEVEATSPEEAVAWGKRTLSTLNPQEAQLLRQSLQRNRRRAEQKGSLLFFESDRAIVNIQPYQFTLDVQDPFSEMVSWDFGFNALKNRFQDTIHSIFRKKRSRREQISREVERLVSASGGPQVTLDMSKFPDPIVPFKEAFSQLLSPKQLLDPEAERQQLFFTDGVGQHPINQLSSGEKEVVNIVFDFLLRNPSDSIVIFDKPELHLHPELSYKLIQTLKNVGTRNQFILCTHSPDIITSALDNSVIFIRPADDNGSNQAVRVREDDDTHQALKLIGQSIGIVSLGRKIVLIEGNHASLDKQTYGSILKSQFPGLVLVPSEGRATIHSFGAVQEKVLSKSIWGVDFYMLCDRDALPVHKDASGLEATGDGKLRVLPRYHLENYFLDARVIATIFADLEPPGSALCDTAQVENMLRESARTHLSYSVALIVSSVFREKVGNIDVMPRGAHAMSRDELVSAMQCRCAQEEQRIGSVISRQEIEKMVHETTALLTSSLITSESDWKRLMPGRSILQTFCSRYAKLDFGRFKTAYLKAAENHAPNPFQEVIEIFDYFSRGNSRDSAPAS